MRRDETEGIATGEPTPAFALGVNSANETQTLCSVKSKRVETATKQNTKSVV